MAYESQMARTFLVSVLVSTFIIIFILIIIVLFCAYYLV